MERTCAAVRDSSAAGSQSSKISSVTNVGMNVAAAWTHGTHGRRRPWMRPRLSPALVALLLVLVISLVLEGCYVFYLRRLLNGRCEPQQLEETQKPTDPERADWASHASQLQRAHKLPEPGDVPSIQAFVGIQTGFSSGKASTDSKYDYVARRRRLRQTWFPGSQQELLRWQERWGIVVRFVVGHSGDKHQEAQLAEEEQEHQDFLRLPLVEQYGRLPLKTLAFVAAVLSAYNPRYIVKVDDDVYLRLDRLPAAVQQWGAMPADYIGCMKRGDVLKSARSRWYEPQHALLGEKYFTHAWGCAYVVSRHAAQLLAAQPPTSLRFLSNEDVTLGLWMLSMNITPFDDRRLCQRGCNSASLAVYDYPDCAGLCDPAAQLPQLHGQPDCASQPQPQQEPPPLLPPIIAFAR